LALDKLEASKHTIYNLGIDKGYSNRQVVRAVEKVTGNNLKVKIGLRREGDPSVLIASSKLANVMLGWRPEMPELERMVNDAWEFYKSTQQ
jgi:UDP-glucose 4-epimerase